jgi:hypothetical protein
MTGTGVARQWWPVLAQVAGVGIIATGFGLLAVWAGVVAAGVGMVAVGTIAEIGQRD